MHIFPAIDLQNGQAVRLLKGDYNQKTVYSDNPTDVAIGFENSGAKFLHTVDLDGAKDGTLSNFKTIESIVKSTNLFVEIGGGIRDEERIERYLDCGISRVILGTAALENFDFLTSMVQKYGEKIAVGVDAKDGKVAVRGWLEVSNTDGISFCKKLCSVGVKTIIYTDISRDGAEEGSNLELYKELSEKVSCDIIASGGVTFLDEITTLKNTGIYGAILGKALYTGAINLSEAIKMAEG